MRRSPGARATAETQPTAIVTDHHQPYVRAAQQNLPGSLHIRTGLHRLTGETTKDPVLQFANPGNGNLYAYAADSPVNYIDPTGKINVVISLAGIAAIVVPDAFVGAAIALSGGTAAVFLLNPAVDVTLGASNVAGIWLIKQSLSS